MLYFDLVASHLKDNQIVLTDGKENYTYEKIDHICGKTASVLKQYGVQANDRVFIIAEHTLDTVLMILTCMYMGVCFVPIPPDISADSLKILLADSSPTLLIGNCKLNSVRCISADKILDVAECQEKSVLEDTNENTISYILYTSGSTGKPKGVVAVEGCVQFCVKAINERLCNMASDKILCCLPLSFDYGLYQIFLSLSSGACLVLPSDMPFPQIVSVLIKEHITGFPAMPAMLSMLLKTRLLNKVRLSELRYITSTGDNFPVNLISRISSAVPSAEIIPMYGLTECKRVSVMPLHCRNKTLSGSCGLPLEGVKVWLDNTDNDGVGELIVCGKNVMKGYWNDEETTEKYFFLNEKNETCLRTGDLFKIDSDGYLYFVGRKKAILKVNGYRIGITELENIIMSEMDDIIDELAIIGCPDEIIGEKIAVCIASSFSKEEISEKLRLTSEKLSAYQRPHILYCSDVPLPKNRNGKIDRNNLKELVLQNECVHIR